MHAPAEQLDCPRLDLLLGRGRPWEPEHKQRLARRWHWLPLRLHVAAAVGGGAAGPTTTTTTATTITTMTIATKRCVGGGVFASHLVNVKC